MQKLIGTVLCCFLLISARTAFGQQQLEVKKILFQLQGCILSGQTVICDFVVTDKGLDRQVTILGNTGSRILDDMGNEYKADNVTMGNASDSDWVSSRLVSNIPVRARLVFANVRYKPKLLSLLEIEFDGLRAQFRNVPLASTGH